MAGLPVPVITLEHQYLVIEPVPELRAHTALFPLVRDPGIRFYLQRERNAFLLGSHAHAGRPAWAETRPPGDFAHPSFPGSLDDILDVPEATIAPFPVLATAGAPNFYHATGVRIGITHFAAIGKARAEWITEGKTEWDLSAWDPHRFGGCAPQGYANVRAAQHYYQRSGTRSGIRPHPSPRRPLSLLDGNRRAPEAIMAHVAANLGTSILAERAIAAQLPAGRIKAIPFGPTPIELPWRCQFRNDQPSSGPIETVFTALSDW